MYPDHRSLFLLKLCKEEKNKKIEKKINHAKIGIKMTGTKTIHYHQKQKHTRTYTVHSFSKLISFQVNDPSPTPLKHKRTSSFLIFSMGTK